MERWRCRPAGPISMETRTGAPAWFHLPPLPGLYSASSLAFLFPFLPLLLLLLLLILLILPPFLPPFLSCSGSSPFLIIFFRLDFLLLFEGEWRRSPRHLYAAIRSRLAQVSRWPFFFSSYLFIYLFWLVWFDLIFFFFKMCSCCCCCCCCCCFLSVIWFRICFVGAALLNAWLIAFHAFRRS